MNYDELYFKFEELFIELACALHCKVPNSLMEDLEFFIVNTNMSATCSTNTSLAYRLGKLSLEGTDAIPGKALVALFLARDSMLKGCPNAMVEDWLRKSEEILASYNACKTMELNLG